MTNTEVDPIQVEDTPMCLQRTLTPRLKLLREGLVEPTDGTCTGSNPQKRLGHFSYLMGTCPGYEHLRQSFCDVRFIAAIALKGLRVELTFTISGDSNVLEPTARCHEVAGVGTVAIAFAFRATFSPSGSDKRIQLLAHHDF